MADAVFARDGNLDELVKALPKDRFQRARPNSGHFIAAALLIEGALRSVVTLNFDMAMFAALAELDGGDSVATITKRTEMPGQATLAYLHGNAFSDPNDWILRTAQLTGEWQAGWRELMATSLLMAPAVVCAGLGSRASAITTTLGLIKAAVTPGVVSIFQVDVVPFGTQVFTQDLEVDQSNYVVSGWCDFMSALSDHVVREQAHRTAQSCAALAAQLGAPTSELAPLRGALEKLTLVDLGRARARWLLDRSSYARDSEAARSQIAGLLLCVDELARQRERTVFFRKDGVVELRAPEKPPLVFRSVCARGVLPLAAVEATITKREMRESWSGVRPKVVVVTGHVGGVAMESVTPPGNVFADSSGDNLMDGPEQLFLIDGKKLAEGEALETSQFGDYA